MALTAIHEGQGIVRLSVRPDGPATCDARTALADASSGGTVLLDIRDAASTLPTAAELANLAERWGLLEISASLAAIAPARPPERVGRQILSFNAARAPRLFDDEQRTANG